MIFTERRGLDIVKELRGLKGLRRGLGMVRELRGLGLAKRGGDLRLSETGEIGNGIVRELRGLGNVRERRD